jgi:hypothetical protein
MGGAVPLLLPFGHCLKCFVKSNVLMIAKCVDRIDNPVTERNRYSYPPGYCSLGRGEHSVCHRDLSLCVSSVACHIRQFGSVVTPSVPEMVYLPVPSGNV